jgi:hypothetical protein
MLTLYDTVDMKTIRAEDSYQSSPPIDMQNMLDLSLSQPSDAHPQGMQ